MRGGGGGVVAATDQLFHVAVLLQKHCIAHFTVKVHRYRIPIDHKDFNTRVHSLNYN